MSLSEQDFFIEYLPIVDIESNNTLGFEALARWYHPRSWNGKRQVNFIEVAESTSLIIQLGEHVLNMACSEAIKWPDEVSLSVNISSVQFKHRLFFEQVVSVLEKTGLDPSPPDYRSNRKHFYNRYWLLPHQCLTVFALWVSVSH